MSTNKRLGMRHTGANVTAAHDETNLVEVHNDARQALDVKGPLAAQEHEWQGQEEHRSAVLRREQPQSRAKKQKDRSRCRLGLKRGYNLSNGSWHSVARGKSARAKRWCLFRDRCNRRSRRPPGRSASLTR